MAAIKNRKPALRLVGASAAYPDWAPPPLVQTYKSYLQNGTLRLRSAVFSGRTEKSDAEIFLRLLTDERMRLAWRTLDDHLTKGQVVEGHVARLKAYWVEHQLEECCGERLESDIALLEQGNRREYLRIVDAVIQARIAASRQGDISRSEVKKRIASVMRCSIALERSLDLLVVDYPVRKLLDDLFEPWLFDLPSMQELLRKLCVNVGPYSKLGVPKPHDPRAHVHRAVRSLGGYFRRRYGRPFYSALAIILSVALEEDVSQDAVKKLV